MNNYIKNIDDNIIIDIFLEKIIMSNFLMVKDLKISTENFVRNIYNNFQIQVSIPVVDREFSFQCTENLEDSQDLNIFCNGIKVFLKKIRIIESEIDMNTYPLIYYKIKADYWQEIYE